MNFRQPYFIRTIVYSIAGIIGAILFGLGIAQPEQVEQITAQVVPVILMLVSSMAAVKANPQSDMPGVPRETEASNGGALADYYKQQ